jgi:hypothetical protein
MKYEYERIALWSIVVALVIVVFFQQRRSGFSVKPGADTSNISVLDMMEYKSIPEAKRTMYKNMLTSNANTLASITDGMMYKMKVDEIMMSALNSNTTVTSNGVIVMGDRLNSNTCPVGLINKTVDGTVYCVCPVPNQYIVPGPKCVPTCPSNMPNVITEDKTKQNMCAQSCPPTTKPGYTCK